MAIRLTVDGSVFEVDTPAEAAELHRVLARKESAHKAATARWSRSPEPKGKRKEHLIAVNPLANALWKAYPNGMSSEDVAKAVRVKPSSLIPMWGHLKKWISDITKGTVGFEDAVDKKPNPNGGGSIFTLTKAGVDLIDAIGKEN